VIATLLLALATPTPEQMEWLKYNAPHGFDIYPDGIWVSAGRDAAGEAYGMLLGDLMRGRGTPNPTIWMRGDRKATKSTKGYSGKFRVTFNCRNNTYQMGTSIRYDSAGTVIWQRQAAAYEPTLDVIPGSMAEIWYGIACPPTS